MNARDFGTALLETGDLDPLYIALHKAGLHSPTLSRYLCAYSAFYNPGLAAYLADANVPFWDVMMAAAKNDTPSPVGGRWTRGSERRHSRGALAVAMVESLRAKCAWPETFSERIYDDTVGGVMTKASQFHNYGPWIGFKLADLLERTHGWRVSFDEGHVFMFRAPRDGAVIVQQETYPGADPLVAVPEALSLLSVWYNDRTAPPDHHRNVNIQEFETILCKYKSHRNGHYAVGHDIREIRASFTTWAPVSALARSLLECMPPIVTA